MLNKLAMGLALGAFVASASAQTLTNIGASPTSSSYAQDGRGVVVRSPYGLCWRTGYWTPADSIAGCDGELAPPILKATAPAFATSSPTSSAPTPAASCNFTIILQHEQTFGFDQAILTDQAKKSIDSEITSKLTACAKTNGIVITGHTDRIGSAQYNQKLSEKRAGVIADYLKNKGFSEPIEVVGAGMSQPVKSCPDKIGRKKLIDCLAPNRRVVIETKRISE